MTAPDPPKLQPGVALLSPYPPGKPIEEVQREYGVADVVKLASNENPLGPSPKAIEAMRAVAPEMHLYPDGAGFFLKAELAKRLGVAPEEIVLGNGSDEIGIFLALCYLGPGRSLVTSDYAFVRYRMAATMVGAETRLAPMREFRHDVGAIVDRCDETTSLVCVDNPCNPTGSMLTRPEVEELVRRVPPGAVVLLDEAYYEFARDDPQYPDGIALRGERANLVATRTFSKAYGLAGLRIGYGVARAEIVRDLERVRPPFNASRMAQAAAIAALDDAAHVERTVANNRRGRERMCAAFEDLGLRHVPSRANFVLVEVAPLGISGGALYEKLLARGVVVRPMGGYGLGDWIRVSIGTESENERFVEELRAAAGRLR